MSSEEKNYVTCKSCSGRTDQYRMKNLCKNCNNSKLVIDPKERLCNKCGETLCPLGTMNEQYPHGLVDAKVRGGFDSYHLFDCTAYIFSICEKCLRELFNQFKIEPTVYETDVWGDSEEKSAWQRDQESYEYRIWVDTGGFHQAYVNRLCNEKKDCPNQAAYTILYGDQQYSEKCCCEEHAKGWDWINQAPNPNSYKLVKFISHTLRAFI